MLHACRIKDGKVSYCNRFVDTFRLAQEEAFGQPMYVKLGDLRGMAGMAHISLNEMRTRMGLAPDAVSPHSRGQLHHGQVRHDKSGQSASSATHQWTLCMTPDHSSKGRPMRHRTV